MIRAAVVLMIVLLPAYFSLSQQKNEQDETKNRVIQLAKIKLHDWQGKAKLNFLVDKEITNVEFVKGEDVEFKISLYCDAANVGQSGAVVLQVYREFDDTVMQSAVLKKGKLLAEGLNIPRSTQSTPINFPGGKYTGKLLLFHDDGKLTVEFPVVVK